MKVTFHSGKAPVCPISRDQAVPGMPGQRLPSVPRAVDFPSAVQAANTIRDILMHLIGPGTTINNIYPPHPIPAPSTDGPNQDGGGGGKKSSRWKEKDRKVIHKKYYGKKTRDIWVEVERISYIKWEDEANDLELELYFREENQPPPPRKPVPD